MYRKGAEDRFLFFFGVGWKVGSEEDVGTETGWMSVADAALHPGAITGGWREADGAGGWVAAPGVKAVGGGAWPAAATRYMLLHSF